MLCILECRQDETNNTLTVTHTHTHSLALSLSHTLAFTRTHTHAHGTRGPALFMSPQNSPLSLCAHLYESPSFFSPPSSILFISLDVSLSLSLAPSLTFSLSHPITALSLSPCQSAFMRILDSVSLFLKLDSLRAIASVGKKFKCQINSLSSDK